jgi:hypothetical protein
MDDSAGTEVNKGKKKFEKLEASSLFTFSKPYLNFISSGKLFSLIYFVMALINPIIPFVILYNVINSGILDYGERFLNAFVLAWLVILFACWIGFQLWWERRKNIKSIGSSEFVATMFFSELMKTFGEWIGTLIGIISAGGGLLASITLGNDVNHLFNAIGMGFLRFGVMVIIIGPIIGFLIILFSHFFAEQLRIWASLANNTKEIAENIKCTTDCKKEDNVNE